MLGLRILMIEDEADILHNRRLTLKAHFPEVQIDTFLVSEQKNNEFCPADLCGDLEASVQYIHGIEPYDIVISDLKMISPRDGLYVLTQAKLRSVGSLLILTTGHNEQGAMGQALSCGAHFYFDKRAYNADENFIISVGNCIDLIRNFKNRCGEVPGPSELDNNVFQVMRSMDTSTIDCDIDTLRDSVRGLAIQLQMQGINADVIDSLDIGNLLQNVDAVINHLNKIRDGYRRFTQN